MNNNHSQYYVLIKDRDGNLDEKTDKTKDTLIALLKENQLYDDSHVGEVECSSPHGLIVFQCSTEVADLIKAQTSLIEDITQINTDEQGFEYLTTKVLKPEELEDFYAALSNIMLLF